MMSRLSHTLEITRSLIDARRGRGHPLYLVHALTARCNARCGFCAWNPEFYSAKDQLSTEAIEKLYTEAKAAGFIGVSVWGGEPLLHPDFGRIMSHAHGLGLNTHMVTNGFLLERKLDAVIPHVDRLCISLDHPSELHDELRGIKGLFERIVAATKAVRARAPSKQIVFICTLQKANVNPESIRGMTALMNELGVLGVFNCLREEPAAEGVESSIGAFVPTQSELTVAFSLLTELKRQGYPILNSYTHLSAMRAGPPVYRCHWPKFMLPIEANGDVVDCMHWGTRPIGNVKDAPFAELLQHPRLRALAGPEAEACHKCVSIHRVEISEVCSGNLEPIRSWSMLRKPPTPVRPSARL
jgi:MoaA/NifB/PqqE/SkfB family radical SAM enzyme